jgi:Flavin containing amine oxidoreductase
MFQNHLRVPRGTTRLKYRRPMTRRRLSLLVQAATMKVHNLAWVAVAAVATAVVHGLSSSSSSSAQQRTIHDQQQERPIFRVAVIGGGWAGFAAAESLAGHCGTDGGAVTVQVTLLDASPRGPGGLAGAGWTTPKLGQPLEAGLHGFWRGYRNTFAMLERIGISTAGADNDDIDDDSDSILTPYLPSALVSATGPVAVAPVLGNASSSQSSTKRSGNAGWLEEIAARLPPPLDIALLTDYDDQSPITVLDRISALGLLGAWLDFNPEDASSWDRYDRITAEQLFRDVARVSPTLYAELIVPLLHVLPMTTGYDCSAAAALSCFHAFALHAKGAFDVRWCKGSIADLIFRPWSDRLAAKGVQIRGAYRLTNLQEELLDPATTASSSTTAKRFTLTVNDNEQIVFDAVILAIGSTAAKRLAPVCTPLLSTLHYREWKTGITCVAVRLFLDRTKVPAAFLAALQSRPAVTVCGPRIILPQLIETGFCVYDLSRVQRGSSGAANNVHNNNNEWLVLEIDFFRANAVAKLSDDAIVDLALAAIETVIVGSSRRRPTPQQQQLLRTESVLDVGIVRAKDAVSHFSMGAARSSPPVRIGRGVYMCGDWIDRRGHASWSTEKAVVTGIDAATQLAADFALSTTDMPSIIPSSNETSRDLITMRETVSFIRKSIPSDIQKRIVAF